MTKEDWNTLFPVELVEHDPAWRGIFEEERATILQKVDNHLVLRIEHFGSTSIPAIKAKPYIDMLIEIPKGRMFGEEVISSFEALGYTYFKVPERDHIEAYMSFGKGYTLGKATAQIYHIHMCPEDHYMWTQLEVSRLFDLYPR